MAKYSVRKLLYCCFPVVMPIYMLWDANASDWELRSVTSSVAYGCTARCSVRMLVRVIIIFPLTWTTHSHSLSLTPSLPLTLSLTNSPTITPPSLSYFLFPCCFSVLNLSLEKLVTCGVLRSYNFVCDVIKFKNYGSLAELLRFQAYS